MAEDGTELQDVRAAPLPPSGPAGVPSDEPSPPGGKGDKGKNRQSLYVVPDETESTKKKSKKKKSKGPKKVRSEKLLPVVQPKIKFWIYVSLVCHVVLMWAAIATLLNGALTSRDLGRGLADFPVPDYEIAFGAICAVFGAVGAAIIFIKKRPILIGYLALSFCLFLALYVTADYAIDLRQSATARLGDGWNVADNATREEIQRELVCCGFYSIDDRPAPPSCGGFEPISEEPCVGELKEISKGALMGFKWLSTISCLAVFTLIGQVSMLLSLVTTEENILRAIEHAKQGSSAQKSAASGTASEGAAVGPAQAKTSTAAEANGTTPAPAPAGSQPPNSAAPAQSQPQQQPQPQTASAPPASEQKAATEQPSTASAQATSEAQPHPAPAAPAPAPAPASTT